MKKNLIKLSSFAVGLGTAAVAPLMAFAQATGGVPTTCGTVGTVTTIQTFICKLNEILSALLPFLVALGIVYFVWGVVSYVIASDEEAKTTGRNRMIYGIIGLVVIVGVWGLVSRVSASFGLSNTQNITYPTVPY